MGSEDSEPIRAGDGDAGEIEALAEYLAHLHPAWHGTPWSAIGEETRALFREEARTAGEIYRGRARLASFGKVVTLAAGWLLFCRISLDGLLF